MLFDIILYILGGIAIIWHVFVNGIMLGMMHERAWDEQVGEYRPFHEVWNEFILEEDPDSRLFRTAMRWCYWIVNLVAMFSRFRSRLEWE